MVQSTVTRTSSHGSVTAFNVCLPCAIQWGKWGSRVQRGFRASGVGRSGGAAVRQKPPPCTARCHGVVCAWLTAHHACIRPPLQLTCTAPCATRACAGRPPLGVKATACGCLPRRALRALWPGWPSPPWVSSMNKKQSSWPQAPVGCSVVRVGVCATVGKWQVSMSL